MADVIHFHCPACGITLSVPPSAAGFTGPCPRCLQEIIGPDPALHTVATDEGAYSILGDADINYQTAVRAGRRLGVYTPRSRSISSR